MAADNFFARWARKDGGQTNRCAEDKPAGNPLDSVAELASAPVSEVPDNRPLPTQDDLEQLTHESDFSVFMGKGVDEELKRSAMKKLFSDPHFNVMDGLDTYIDDYTKFEAMTPSVLASLHQVKDLLDPWSRIEKSISNLLDAPQNTTSASASLFVPDEATASDKDVSAAADAEPRDAEKTTLDEKPQIGEDKDSE
jgi:hypothetical protein